MNQTISNALTILLVAVLFVGVPVLLISGWFRWITRSQSRTAFSIISLVGFAIGTASVLLALSAFFYGQVYGGFPFYDPLLLAVYRVGLVISITGIIVGIAGVWRSNLLRWHAPLLSCSMLLFWFLMAIGE